LVDVLGRQIAGIDQPLRALLSAGAPQLKQLGSIPGVHDITARDIIAEIGLASWAGLSPGNNDSAGKRRQGR